MAARAAKAGSSALQPVCRAEVLSRLHCCQAWTGAISSLLHHWFRLTVLEGTLRWKVTQGVRKHKNNNKSASAAGRVNALMERQPNA